MKNLFSILLSLCLMGCYHTDHFEVKHRLNDEQILAYEENESFQSQYEYLFENDIFTVDDFNAEVFGSLSLKQRVAIYLKLFPDTTDEDKFILEHGRYYNRVNKLWILTIFGPPRGKSLAVGGYETWFYANKMFEFHREEMVMVKDL